MNSFEGGRASKVASEELQRDGEVVLAAVVRYGRALEYASEELQNDPGIVEAAHRSR